MDRDTNRLQEAVQADWSYNVRYDFDLDVVTDIIKKSGSKRLKNTIQYFRFVRYYSQDKFFSIIVDDSAFLAGTFAKSHFRLIDIAVKKDLQNLGYGKLMLCLLFQQCIENNIYVVTFRTAKDEPAFLWYKKLGAKIVGTNKNDYEMRFDI